MNLTSYSRTSIVCFLIASAPFLCISNESRAQQWNGSTTSTGAIDRAGEVSIYPTLMNRVTLGNAGPSSMTFGTGYVGLNWARNGSTGSEWTYIGDGARNGAAAMWTDVGGDLCFSTKPSTSGSSGASSDNFFKNAVHLRVTGDGKVVIGNPAQYYNVPIPGTYNLYVEGGILTEKIRVAVRSSSDWQDQVFDADYKLPALSYVRNYIAKNHHLPGIPSTQEVMANGVDIQQMDSKLLQKIEELTLYLLKQQEEIDALKRQVRRK